MKFSQMLSMLNGLCLSTNVAALALTTNMLELQKDDAYSWSYTYNQPAKKEPNFMYLISE